MEDAPPGVVVPRDDSLVENPPRNDLVPVVDDGEEKKAPEWIEDWLISFD
jgi:hypothetical protein